MLARESLPSSEYQSANQDLRAQELKARWNTARWLARCEADPQWREQTESAPYTPTKSRGSPNGTMAASPGYPAHANGWAVGMPADTLEASAAFRQLALDGARRPPRLSDQLGGFGALRQTPSLSRSGLLV